MSFHKIRTSFIWLSLITIVCRIVGLFREIFTAKFFGTTGIYDAFLIAFMIPNFFRGLLAEGALSTAFIPVVSEMIAKEEKKEEILKITGAVFTFFLISTTLLYIFILFASWVSLKFFSLPPKIAEILFLLRFTFPYLIFVSLAAWAMGVLNARHRFVIPGLNPVVLDFWWIFSLFFLTGIFGNTLEKKIFGLLIGILLGGLTQFVFQLPSVYSNHGPIVLNTQWNHPAIKKMVNLFLPVIIGVSVGPINLLVDYSFARSLVEGSVSALWYATRVYQLPLGVFSISLATVLLPYLSGDVATKKIEQVKENIHKSLEQTVFLLVPSAIGMIVFRKEIIEVLFKRGLFTQYSVDITAGPLLFYSIGLVFYGMAIIITRAFYAHHDTATPVKIGLLSIVTNAVFDFILMRFMGHNGIALSTSIVGLENFVLLFFLFKRKFGILETKRFSDNFLRILVFNLGWGIIVQAIRILFLPYGAITVLFVGVIIGIFLYLGGSSILNFPEIKGIRIFQWKV